MFTSDTKREALVENLRAAREARTQEKITKHAAEVIQRTLKRHSEQQKVLKSLKLEVEQCLSSRHPSGLDLFHAARKVLFIDRAGTNVQRLDQLCKALLASMESERMKEWYVSVVLDKTYSVAWIAQIKNLLVQTCSQLKQLKAIQPQHRNQISIYLQMLTIFTDCTLWKLTEKAEAMRPVLLQLSSKTIGHLVEKGMYTSLNELLMNSLCCVQPCLNKVTLPAAMAIRCIALCDFPVHMVTMFLVNILTVPAVIMHLHNLSPESCSQLTRAGLLSKCLTALDTSDQCRRIVLGSLDGERALCLLCNLVNLVLLEKEAAVDPATQDRLLGVLCDLLRICYERQGQKKRSHCTWHPVFGWFEQTTDKRHLEAAPHILKQMQLLWKREFVSLLFAPLLALTPAAETTATKVPASQSTRFKKFRLFLSSLSSTNKLPSNEERRILNVCSYFQLSMKCLPNSRMDILTSISYHGDVIPKLWFFLSTLTKLTPEGVCQAVGEAKSAQTIDAFKLFCQVACHLIAVLDDSEFYVREEPFKLSDLVELGHLLNHISFNLIWKTPKGELRDDVLLDCLLLLSVLYDRDTRRPFCPENFWLIKDVRFSLFLSEFKHGKERALELLGKLPHCIPHRQRVELFRERVTSDKKALGIIRPGDLPSPSTYITIRRPRLLEDGHEQLATLTTKALKSTIRVKFFNEQGLEEAGIDEHGVFKEFLEDIIKKAFDPDLNLFKTNSESRLYPSATSHVNPNHLSYFEFLGRLLGKAVYEGIVVDVPFASFFVSQLLGHHRHALYSPYDELPSLDPNLYRSLQSVKNYEGDVSDLCLTFSWDEDFMGKVVPHELKEGGSVTAVTNDNRISYIHLVAHFHMHTRTKLQTASFVRGFRSVIPQEWVACFSAPELQRLISGDNIELDVDDLKRHTVYYGGYHPTHRVVLWLWDILRGDFNKEEKGLFLKFVTSCSRPPLLGFQHLEPKFSIRFVDVDDDEDSGDTVLSVMKGFFSVRRRQSESRLPTASTCFNLLKLPNYSKKSVLRDKLKYAIHSNAGFELS